MASNNNGWTFDPSGPDTVKKARASKGKSKQRTAGWLTKAANKVSAEQRRKAQEEISAARRQAAKRQAEQRQAARRQAAQTQATPKPAPKANPNKTTTYKTKQGIYELPEAVVTAKKPVMTSLDAPRNKAKLQSSLVNRFKRGTDSYNVASMQKQLLNLGFYGEGATSKQQIDGKWGKNTDAAWKAAQKAGYVWKNGTLMSKKEHQAYQAAQKAKEKAKMEKDIRKQMQKDNEKALKEAMTNTLASKEIAYDPNALGSVIPTYVPNTYLNI